MAKRKEISERRKRFHDRMASSSFVLIDDLSLAEKKKQEKISETYSRAIEGDYSLVPYQSKFVQNAQTFEKSVLAVPG